MARQPSRDAFNVHSKPDEAPLRDKDNAAPAQKPDVDYKPAPNLAPTGMSGIRSSQPRPAPVIEPSAQKPPIGFARNQSPDDLIIEGRIIAMPGYTFQAQMDDHPSRQGIDGGHIAKLDIRKDGALVASYDRGWDKDPKTPEAREALHRIRDGLGDIPKRDFKGFDQDQDKGQAHDR